MQNRGSKKVDVLVREGGGGWSKDPLDPTSYGHAPYLMFSKSLDALFRPFQTQKQLKLLFF